MAPVARSTGLMYKMTKAMDQKGIDMSKHGGRKAVNKGMILIEVVMDLGLDWYTSTVLGDLNVSIHLNMSKAISSPMLSADKANAIESIVWLRCMIVMPGSDMKHFKDVNYDKAISMTKHVYECKARAKSGDEGNYGSKEPKNKRIRSDTRLIQSTKEMAHAVGMCPVTFLLRNLLHKRPLILEFLTYIYLLGVATGGKPRPTRQTMDDRFPDDGLLFMSEEDFVVDFASDDLECLSWNAPYDTNDAAFADVHQETTFADAVDSVNTNSFNIYSDHINPILHNAQELPAVDTTYLDILPVDWDFMTMPTDPNTTALAGSITTTEQSNYSTTYTSSSSPTTQSSPTGLSQSKVPNPWKDAKSASTTTTRRRRTKMEPGTRPCDLKRQKRKEDKPEKCHICEKGHQWKRDLERHYQSNHPDEAAKMGLSRRLSHALFTSHLQYHHNNIDPQNPRSRAKRERMHTSGNQEKTPEQQKIEDSGTGNRTLGSAVLISQLKLRARNVSHYTIPDVA
ncbi:zinc finger MSN2 [Fusarium sp. NRRL 52700]|nr:zinc finger MSN2 [Fusarium sp. NRRL 52700]